MDGVIFDFNGTMFLTMHSRPNHVLSSDKEVNR